MAGLYIHIPFCEKKCNYCDFFSLSGKEDQIEDYIESVVAEIGEKGKLLERPSFSTVYFGGGTPSFIESKHIGRIMEEVREYFDLEEGAEVTLEVNPGTVDEAKLHDYLSFGVNRLSIGAQSSDDRLLQVLGRIHDRAAISETVALGKKVGFKNISLDFMYGLPGEDLEMIRDNLAFIEGMDVPHISYYGLSIEEGTPFYHLEAAGKLALPGEELLMEMRDLIDATLRGLGYIHYEISNYGRDGFFSKHNLIYWHNEDYLAIGAGGTTKWGNQRYHNKEDIEGYVDERRMGVFKTYDLHLITQKEGIEEGIFLGLRLLSGIDLKEFNVRYGIDLLKEYEDVIEKLDGMGCLEIDRGRMRLTKKGIEISNYCLALFL